MITEIEQHLIERISRLRAVVASRRVAYLTLPLRWPRDAERPCLGFQIDLRGSHEHRTDTPGTECTECKQTRGDLLEIADWIVPAECEEARDDGAKCALRLRFAPRTVCSPTVFVEVDVLCRNGFGRSRCACEVSCLHEMELRLEHLGARRVGGWSVQRVDSGRQ